MRYEESQEHLVSHGMKFFSLYFILTTTLHDRIAGYFISIFLLLKHLRFTKLISILIIIKLVNSNNMPRTMRPRPKTSTENVLK